VSEGAFTLPVSPVSPETPQTPGIRVTDAILPPEVPDLHIDRGIHSVADDPSSSGLGLLERILLELLRLDGSDLHLNAGLPPMIRRDGDVLALQGWTALTPRQIHETVYSILTGRQQQRFEEDRELDFAFELTGAARFRVNLMWQRGSIAATFRVIPWDIKPLEALELPAALDRLPDLPRGLVLVTGPTGSGKSTTLASMIDRINRTHHGHIITVEDPVEFVHDSRTCVVSQREVGTDTPSFASALKHALRQDPDVILVGEMRDLETISIALTAAETGHLVFGTLHTSSAASTIDRIVDVFPPEQQAQVRTQLAGSLQAVVCQTLCRRASGSGRVAATEVMIVTPAIRNLIREGKIASIPSALQTGSRQGMHTLNQDLARLVIEGTIDYETALARCSDAAELDQLLGRDADDSD
jgi:twitching motility protein PilT